MKKFKDIFIGILIGCILMTSCPVLADSIMQKIDVVLNSVNVQINGEKLETSTILYDGTTYLPMRKIAEAVGKDVDWNQETMTANIVAKIVTGSAIKPIDDVKVGDNVENEFKIIEEKNGIPIIVEKNGENYYTINYSLELMQKYGDYTFNNKDGNISFILFKNGKTIAENIPYTIDKGILLISKSYYENTILPLIKK